MEEKSINVISKMSVKGLGCNPRKVTAMDKPADGSQAKLPLCRIFGLASGVKHGEDKSGNVWTAIAGDFEGVNLQDGKVYRSGKLFLPGGIQEIIEVPLVQAESQDKQLTVEFAFEIAAVQADNPIGYSYVATSLMKPAEADNLSRIRNLISAPAQPAVPQLPAPETATPKPAADVPSPKPAATGKRK